jgi:hypothetical protein
MSCHNFSAGEAVTIRWNGNDLTSTTADSDGSLSTSVETPGGFAGANTPGRVFTLRAEGQQSGRHASASFTVQSQTDTSTPTESSPPTEPPPTPASTE